MSLAGLIKKMTSKWRPVATGYGRGTRIQAPKKTVTAKKGVKFSMDKAEVQNRVKYARFKQALFRTLMAKHKISRREAHLRLPPKLKSLLVKPVLTRNEMGQLSSWLHHEKYSNSNQLREMLYLSKFKHPGKGDTIKYSHDYSKYHKAERLIGDKQLHYNMSTLTVVPPSLKRTTPSLYAKKRFVLDQKYKRYAMVKPARFQARGEMRRRLGLPPKPDNAKAVPRRLYDSEPKFNFWLDKDEIQSGKRAWENQFKTKESAKWAKRREGGNKIDDPWESWGFQRKNWNLEEWKKRKGVGPYNSYKNYRRMKY